jgi:O-antigen ligase
MSAIGLRIPQPIVLLAGAASFLALGAALIWLHLSPVILLGGMLTIAGGILIWFRPYVGLHVFIAMLFLEYAIPGEEGVTAIKVIGGIILFGWLLAVATRRHPGIRLDWFAIAVLAFLIWCGVTLVFAFDSFQAASRLFTFSQLGLAALMFRSVADSPARLRGVYWEIVAWTWFSTIVGIAGYYMGMAGSAAGLLKNKNLMASYINIAIICAYLLYGMTRHKGARLLLAASLPVFFLGAALSFSRGGLVSLGVALILVWYFSARQRSFQILFASAALMLTIAFVLPETFWKRAGSIVPAIRHQEDTFGSRVRIWKVGWAMVQDRPITGVGAGNFNLAYPRYGRRELVFSSLAPHNTYVGMAAETGLVGLALYLLVHLSSLRLANRASSWGLENDRVDLHMLAVAAQVCILSMMVGGLSGDAQTGKMLWMWLGLTAGIGTMVPRKPIAARQEIPGNEGAPLPGTPSAWGAPQ